MASEDVACKGVPMTDFDKFSGFLTGSHRV